MSYCHESSEPIIGTTMAEQSTESMEQSAPNTHLLSLPKEVRIKILRELLYHRQALAREHDKQNWGLTVWARSFDPGKRLNKFSFSPQILRVCRKLYEEGFSVLYCENCLQICRFSEVWNHDPPLWTRMRLPVQLQKHMHTFEIHMEVSREEIQQLADLDENLGKYGFERAARFVRSLDEYFSLRHLTIHVTAKDALTLTDVEPYLKVLRFLRCERVKFIFNGTVADLMWKHEMESTGRAVDIYSTAMSIISSLPGEGLEEPRRAVRAAFHKMDLEDLEKARSYAIAEVEREHAAQRTRLAETIFGHGGSSEGARDRPHDIDPMSIYW